MGIHLVTGYAGKEHITAADKGAYQAGIVGSGKYVLQSGNMFEAQIISNNLIKVKDGDLLNQGRHIHIAVDDYEECTIENGTQSRKRNDLIVVRYTRNTETAIETAQMLVLKGTPGATAIDPECITGDILNGDAVDDFPLYRVKLNGLNITEVEPLFSTIVPYKELVEKVERLNTDLGTAIFRANDSANITFTMPFDGWAILDYTAASWPYGGNERVFDIRTQDTNLVLGDVLEHGYDYGHDGTKQKVSTKRLVIQMYKGQTYTFYVNNVIGNQGGVQYQKFFAVCHAGQLLEY